MDDEDDRSTFSIISRLVSLPPLLGLSDQPTYLYLARYNHIPPKGHLVYCSWLLVSSQSLCVRAMGKSTSMMYPSLALRIDLMFTSMYLYLLGR